MATASDVQVSIGIDTAALQRGMAEARQAIANAVGGVETQFQRMGRAANDAGRAVESSAARARSSSGAWAAMRVRMMGAVAAAVSLRTAFSAVGTADRMARLQARVESLTGSTEDAKQATDSLFTSAQALQAPYEDLVGVFARLLPAVQELGGGVDEARRLSEALMITSRASGASTAEGAAAAQQFAQALASGVLQGDELRSILENNNALARLIAEGLGTTVGNLRKMGSEGELTAERVANAILKQQSRLATMASQLPQTVGGAWTQAMNTVTRFVSELDRATGSSSRLVTVFRAFAVIIETATQLMRGLRDTQQEAFKADGVQFFGEVLIRTFAFVGDAATLFWQALDRAFTIMGGIARVARDALSGEFEKAGQTANRVFEEIIASYRRTADVLSGGGLVGRIPSMLQQIRGSGSMSLDVGGASPGVLSGSGAAGAAEGGIERDTAGLDALIADAEAKYERLERIQAEYRRQMEAPFYAWKAQLQEGLASLFTAVANGSMKLRDAVKAAFRGLLDITLQSLARLAAEVVVNALFGQAVTIKSAFAKIKAYAAEAGAAGVASTAAIPGIGPGMAVATGKAMSTAAMAFAGMLAIPSARGGFDVPAGVQPLTQLHEREMVLPQNLADSVRRMSGEDGAGRGVQIHNHISAIDAYSFRRYLEQNSSDFTAAIRYAVAKGGLLPR